MKFYCVKDVKSVHGEYFTAGKEYDGHINDHGELFATDDNGKNFQIGINADDEWYKEHFSLVPGANYYYQLRQSN
jgi:hypothetical protein